MTTIQMTEKKNDWWMVVIIAGNRIVKGRRVKGVEKATRITQDWGKYLQLLNFNYN
jgi:hypothetical protein